jgi:hypothetical protein
MWILPVAVSRWTDLANMRVHARICNNATKYQEMWTLFGPEWNRVHYHRGHYWPAVPASDDERGAVRRMLGRGNRSIRRKPAAVPLSSPQIPDDLTPNRNRAAAMGSRRLPTYGTATVP